MAAGDYGQIDDRGNIDAAWGTPSMTGDKEHPKHPAGPDPGCRLRPGVTDRSTLRLYRAIFLMDSVPYKQIHVDNAITCQYI